VSIEPRRLVLAERRAQVGSNSVLAKSADRQGDGVAVSILTLVLCMQISIQFRVGT
jgi:hypothetical protein